MRAADAVVAAIDQAALAIFLAQKCAEEGPGAAQRKKGGWCSAPAVPVRGAWWHADGLFRQAAQPCKACLLEDLFANVAGAPSLELVVVAMHALLQSWTIASLLLIEALAAACLRHVLTTHERPSVTPLPCNRHGGAQVCTD